MEQIWEFAVLTVEASIVDGKWQYLARAWVNETEIYKRSLDNMFWSAPLADLAVDGWDLDSTQSANALIASHLSGISGPLSWPVCMNFFLKRAAK